MKARYTPTIGVEALLPLPWSSSPTWLGEPLSCPCLSSVSVVHLPWPPPPPPPGSGCRKAGGTNVGWPCPGRTQPAGSGGGHRKTQWKKNDSVVCVCVCVCVSVRGRFWIDFQNLFTPPNLLVLCLESPLQPRTLQIFLFLSSGIASLISIVDPMWNLF